MKIYQDMVKSLIIEKLHIRLPTNELQHKYVRKIRFIFRKLLFHISPVLLIKFRYVTQKGRLPDIWNPKILDEKLIWLNLFWRHPLKTICADKYMVRSYVKEHGLGHILPPLLGVYEQSREINFAALPESFVLKCTHGCGFNLIYKSKKHLNESDIKRQLDGWMKIDYSKRDAELHYAAIPHRIICEPFLNDLSSELPVDYKVYCFNGKAHCTMACLERNVNSPAKYYVFYDSEWKSKLSYTTNKEVDYINIAKPAGYDEMIRAAEELSKPFPFVRMDFYSIKGKAILGEMTFTPTGCIDKDLNDLAQEKLGALLELPKKPLL